MRYMLLGGMLACDESTGLPNVVASDEAFEFK